MRTRRTTIDGITEREREVIELLAQGKMDRQIASTLNISLRTAQNHVRSVREKVGVRTRAAVIAYVLHYRLISTKDEYFVSGD